MYQLTGVSMGSVQYSDSHYLTVGCAVDQSPASISHYDQRNIFVIANRRDDVNDNPENLTWLTNFAQGHKVTLSPPTPDQN